ncbi:MAG: nucleotidyltransferase domain-containing protein [Deltaproteobacteria bacterium]|nr:nucleotidyltransferase domain-containing protein [Deltaproteobacteria bacterium]
MMSEQSSEKRSDEIVEYFSARVRQILGTTVVGVYWFGSRVRERDKPDSDYDILLETTSVLSEEQRDAVADLAIDIVAEHSVLLDIHYYTSDEITRPPFSRSPFVHAVLEEGVRL